jgi:hypothetical protein
LKEDDGVAMAALVLGAGECADHLAKRVDVASVLEGLAALKRQAQRLIGAASGSRIICSLSWHAYPAKLGNGSGLSG